MFDRVINTLSFLCSLFQTNQGATLMATTTTFILFQPKLVYEMTLRRTSYRLIHKDNQKEGNWIFTPPQTKKETGLILSHPSF